MNYAISDLHFNHDKEFVWKARGFESVDEMNRAIVENWNSVITDEDDVYVLGDLMLGDNVIGVELLSQLKGRIHIVLGNHDTEMRVKLYKAMSNVVEVVYATMVHYKKHHFFLTHYPCLTGNLEKESLKACTLNLYGHTHQKDNFYYELPFVYHVGCDSHNCTPISFDEIIADMQNKCEECLKKI